MARGQLDLFSLLVGGFVGHRLGKRKSEQQTSSSTGEISDGAIYLLVVMVMGIGFAIYLVAYWLFGEAGSKVAFFGMLGIVVIAFVWFKIVEPLRDSMKKHKQPVRDSNGFKYTYGKGEAEKSQYHFDKGITVTYVPKKKDKSE